MTMQEMCQVTPKKRKEWDKQELEQYRDILEKYHIGSYRRTPCNPKALEEHLHNSKLNIAELEELIEFLLGNVKYEIRECEEKHSDNVNYELVIKRPNGKEDNILLGEYGEELLGIY